MIRTLLLLQCLTLRGRVIRSVRLLKQPKYLLGAVVGSGWMLFWVGRPILQSDVSFNMLGAAGFEDLARDLGPVVHLLAGAIVTMVLTVPWLFPWGRLGLRFREAELTMLLQAPLSRRRIVAYGILKASVGIVITAFFLALIFGAGGTDRTNQRAPRTTRARIHGTPSSGC